MTNYHDVYVLGIDIGNKSDLSIRIKEKLQIINIFFCENTLTTKSLLISLNIKIQNKEFISLHKFNESSRKELIIEKLQKQDVGIISETGIPTISDPGQYIINFLISNNIKVIPIPGTSALITALQASGLIFNDFYFGGFLPKQQKQILKYLLSKINSDITTFVFYESPKRITNILKILNANFTDFNVVVCRELTKKHEEIFYGKANDILNNLSNYKGEFVIIFQKPNNYIYNNDLLKKINLLKKLNLTNQEQIKVLVEIGGYKKNQIYNLLKS